MATYQTQFTQQLGASNEIIKVTIEYGADFDGDGYNDLKVTLSLDPSSNSGTDDMLGVAFDINGDAVSGLQIVGIQTSEQSPTQTLSTYTPAYAIGANQVSNLPLVQGTEPDFQLDGATPFDVAIQFSDQGLSDGIVQTASFIIKKPQAHLDKTLLENTDWYVRLQSTDGGEQSAKTGGTIGTIDGGGLTPNPGIAINKLTNGADGETILEGSAITWTYAVTNTGNVELSNVAVTDSDLGTITSFSGDTDNDGKLDLTETWTYTKTGTAVAGDYSNIGTVTGKYNGTPVTANDPSSYFGANPGIAINKLTNGFDGKTILEGSAITWTYAVTNTGNVALSNVAVTDDKLGTITSFSGDTDNDSLLDLNETWTYTKTGTAVAGNYSNMGTVTGSFTDGLGKTETVTDDDPSSYFGANPGINIDKVTNNFSVQGDALLIQEASAIEWIYTVTNTGNVGLSNVSVTDNKGVIPVGVDANNDGFIDGDINKDKILDTTETWTYKAPGTSILGSYQNTGTATGSFTDGLGKTEIVNDSDDSSYTGVKPAGARTPGFWKNWAAVWDGNASNDSTFAGRAGFPGSDILLAPYSASTTDPVTGNKTLGVLVGDWNRNGVTDGTEKTIFYTLSEAMTIISADQKTQQDKRYTLDRSLIASWLNFLAVNPAPQGDMNQAIQWMQQNTPNENSIAGGDGNLVLGASTWAVPASSQAWANSSDVFGGLPTGEVLNAKLDYYNNTGSFGIQPV
jgi:hypothetical protein